MAFDKITEYSATNASNTAIGDVNVQEGMLPSAVNNAIREQMTHLKESLGSGTPLYVDQTNNRLGVNNAAPATALDVTGTVTATAYTGDGSALTGIAAGATGGGSDQIFYENGQTVTTNYTITDGKNAMSAGPITINSGITVTVGTGETWTVV